MRIPALVTIAPLLFICGCGRPDSPGTAAPPASASATPAAAAQPATARTAGQASTPTLSSAPPSDMPANATQAQAVTYAWQQFVAVNWPAASGQRGVPDSSKTIGQAGTSVWHTWKTPEEIFYAGGQAPPPWNQFGAQLPPECVTAGAAAESFVLQRTSKVPGNSPNDAIQDAREAIGGTLTDQHGKLARYEVRLNQAMFNGIVGPKLYSVAAQDAASEIEFPSGVMEVKASWREMTSADSPAVVARYYTEEAWIYTPPFGSSPATCVRGRVGLVGLHITQKTPTMPQWTWATFEQIDNVPPGAGSDTGAFSFNNPACPAVKCPPNRSTERNGVPTGVPTQVTRMIPIGADAALANPVWQQALAQAASGSPFQYYQLIDVQWPTLPARPPNGSPTPLLLANTTMETYLPESSCLNCHFTARTQSGKLSSDFSFMLAEARGAATPRAK